MNFLKTTILPPNYKITLILIPTFLYGYDLGSSGGILATITHRQSLSHLESGLVISSIILGTLIGLLISSRVAQWINYRTFLVISVIIYVIPTILILLLDSVSSYIYLRIIIGCATGMISFISPLYLHKIENTESNKSSFMALYQIWIGLGFCFAQICLLIFYSFHSWEIIVAISLLPAVIFLFQFKQIPIVSSSQQAQFNHSSQRTLHREAEISAAERNADRIETRSFSLDNKSTKRVSIALILAVAQQLTGNCIVNFYSPQIYHTLIRSEFSSLLLSFLAGLPGFVSSSFSRKLANKVSVKNILLGGSGFTIVGMILLAISTRIPTGNFIFGVLGCSIILASFPISWGAMLWPALTITLPDKNKEGYMALCVALNSITVFFISTYTAYFLNRSDMLKLFLVFILFNVMIIFVISSVLTSDFAKKEDNSLSVVVR